mgnify:CR=1 FL=1
MCEFRISETSASAESIYKLYECVMSKTEIVNRIKFFKQIGEEIERVKSARESPEIIALVADWGQGKTTLLSVLEEVTQVTKLNFVDVLKSDLSLDGKVILIDEVETSIELLPQYKDEIRNFWIKIKDIANSKGNKVIYLSMTPSAYSKIFGEVLKELFPETYEAITQRVKKVFLMPPNKLEFLAVIDCLLDFNKQKDKKILEYLDLPYWTIGQERRKFARFFNDVICKSLESKDPVNTMFKLLVDNQNLNDEGETIRVNEVLKFERELDKNEIKEFHRELLSRIFLDKPLEKLKDHVVEGYLVDYYSWAEIAKDLDSLEDFLLVYIDEKDNFDQNLYIFLSKDIDKVIYENINKGNIEEIVEKLKVRSKRKAYALTWNIFETLVNTNIGGSIVEFESRQLKEKAIKFVNERLIDEEKEVEAFVSFLRHGMGLEFEEKKLDRLTTLLISKYNIIVAKKPVKLPEDYIVHGVILLSDDFSLDNYYESLSVKVLHLPLNTVKKRQMLYINFYELYQKGVRLRKELVNIKLADIVSEVKEFLSSIEEELSLPNLPIAKGNKRPIQSFNWIAFAPEIYPAKASEVFAKVNEIVNERFRIFGSKQFHLEDIETAETFIEDVIQYFAENKIINVNGEIIDFSNLAGERVKEFTRVMTGLLRQMLKDRLENEIAKYIKEEKGELLSAVQKIFGVKKSASLEFMVYSSIATGEIGNFINVRKIVSLKEIKDHLEKINVKNELFITAKKRAAGIRKISEMINTIKEYINLAEKSDERNYVRLAFVAFMLDKQLSKFVEEVSIAEENIAKIKNEIEKKVEIINKAKRLVNVKEVEEEKLLLNLPQIVEEIKERFVKVVEEEEPEDLMNFVDTVKKISGNESSNLDLIIWETVKIIMDGASLPFTEKLKSVFSPIMPLAGINHSIVKLDAEVKELEKTYPEINKIHSQLEEKRKELQKLIQEIKREVGGK